MIRIFEQDRRTWLMKPFLFRGVWDGQKTWRIGWGLWSLSYYPSPGIREFFEHVKNTQWHD
jgi:hypothetical protein